MMCVCVCVLVYCASPAGLFSVYPCLCWVRLHVVMERLAVSIKDTVMILFVCCFL